MTRMMMGKSSSPARGQGVDRVTVRITDLQASETLKLVKGDGCPLYLPFLPLATAAEAKNR